MSGQCLGCGAENGECYCNCATPDVRAMARRLAALKAEVAEWIDVAMRYRRERDLRSPVAAITPLAVAMARRGACDSIVASANAIGSLQDWWWSAPYAGRLLWVLGQQNTTQGLLQALRIAVEHPYADAEFHAFVDQLETITLPHAAVVDIAVSFVSALPDPDGALVAAIRHAVPAPGGICD